MSEPALALTFSPTVANLAPALLEAQRLITAVARDRVGRVVKDGRLLYEYDYADLADVVEAVKPHLNACGICIVQGASGTQQGVVVATVLLHESGEWARGELYMPVAGTMAQSYGSAISYGKRYGLQAMTALPSKSEDDDADGAGKGKTGDGGEQTGSDVGGADPGAGEQTASSAPKPTKRVGKLDTKDFQAHKNAIGNAVDELELKRAFTAAYVAAHGAGDNDAVSRLTDCKDVRKTELAEAAAAVAKKAPPLASQP